MNNVIDDRIVVGARVLVYDYLRFKDDVTTPCSMLYKPATVVQRYGTLSKRYSADFSLGPYPDLVDVVFDERPDRISAGHFTDGVKFIEQEAECTT